MNLNLFKLAKMILNLGSAKLEDGTVLNWDGELVEGTEVFVENEGEIVPAADGEYVIDEKKITIAEGKVASIEDVKPEAEPENKPEEQNNEEQPPVNEPTNEPDDKDAKIAELEAKIAELEAENAELKSQLEGKNQEMSAAEEQFNAQLTEANNKVAELELQLSQPANVPAKDKDKMTKTNSFKSYL